MRHLTSFVLLAAMAAGCRSLVRSPMAEHTVAPAQPLSARQLAAFHRQRVKRDPGGAIGWAMLAEALLDQARQEDNDQAGIDAEAAARKSLQLRRVGNSRAAMRLTQALLQQHRFREAEKAARTAHEIAHGAANADRLWGQTLLEIGEYGQFKALARKNLELFEGPEGLSLLARWNDVSGSPEEALKCAAKAIASAGKLAGDSPAVGWYWLQQGELLRRYGRISEARESLHKAYELNPKDYRTCAAETRLAAASGDWKGLLEWGDRTAALARMTDIQGLQAKACRELGLQDREQQLLQQIDVENGITPALASQKGHESVPQGRHTHSRLYAMHLADAGRYPWLAHHLAEEDLKSRSDIYAWDTFAWATYRYFTLVPASETGEGDKLLTEARSAMRKALATGSKDPLLLAHAAKILDQ